MSSASARLICGFLFVFLIVICGGGRTIRAEETQTVEGVWEVVSVSPLNSSAQDILNKKISIVRRGDGYEVQWLDGPLAGAPVAYSGSEKQIVKVYNDPITDDGWVPGEFTGGSKPATLAQEIAGKTWPDTVSYTLSVDGNSIQKSWDAVRVYWENGHYSRYEVSPGYFKQTLNRVSGSTKVESHGEHAYAANCGPTVPNRTAPITTDLCPGNLVAQTFFCGGDTGCPYVCCPKGLPYLNHCDCKCYAAATDFECGSHSVCQVQQRQ